jgi:hypothetical protein
MANAWKRKEDVNNNSSCEENGEQHYGKDNLFQLWRPVIPVRKRSK